MRNELGTLRYCSQAGGHMSGYIKRELRRVLPSHTQIYIMYGATEASARLTYLEPDKYDEKIDTLIETLADVKKDRDGFEKLLREVEKRYDIDRDDIVEIAKEIGVHPDSKPSVTVTDES